MSEGKSALFAKTVQKHAGRAKEKVFIAYPFTLQCFYEVIGLREVLLVC